jgi:hypothetical protein
MDDSEIPRSDAYSMFPLYGNAFKILGGVGIVGGVMLMMTGYRLDGSHSPGTVEGILAIAFGIVILALGFLLSVAGIIGESIRASQLALQALVREMMQRRGS